ncbi:hypothetical protein PISMIDRAFT_234983 [Pisolithus microcarpus 441]|uniref:Unplaced genomic scaffold scaffold_152, whole genome shotgun sequence n=1 Tax=Pisolithus microcarpus 441 TaxID=765257 RepID=A0A0C9Z438_9AGAM|nr:hypothetical protein PISMIDRAFT_234983 [Pisolithus microcarpus 441]
MPNPLRPSKNAVIYSLVDGEPYVGIPPTRPVTVPVSFYARDSVTEAPTVSDLASRSRIHYPVILTVRIGESWRTYLLD